MIAAVEDTKGGLLDEELIDLNEARRTLIPKRNGKPIGPSTMWRWICTGPKDQRLEIVYCGRTPYTSRKAVARFLARQTASRMEKKNLVAQVDEDELRAAGLL